MPPEADRPVQDRAPRDEESAYQPWVEHMARVWLAEEENARRNLERTKLLATAIIAFFAVGLFRMGLELFGPPGTPTEALARLALLCGLAWMLSSTPYLFRVPPRWGWSKKRRRGIMRRAMESLEYRQNASLYLAPRRRDELEALSDPPRGTAEHSRQLTFFVTLVATTELRNLNGRRDTELYVATRRFVRGMVCAVVAVVLHMATPVLDPLLESAVGRLGYTEKADGEKGSSSIVLQQPEPEPLEGEDDAEDRGRDPEPTDPGSRERDFG